MSDALVEEERLPGGVARLTLNRPEKRNPLSNALRSELFAALERIDQDPTLRVTILRGAGGHFSAGYDLKQNSAENQPFYTPGAWGTGPGTWWMASSA